MVWESGAGLEGKGVVVTGAARGIGRSVAAAFASAGAHVLAVDRDADGLESSVEALNQGGEDRHKSFACDIADLSSHAGILETAVREFGRIDHLAHVAAVLRRRDSIEEVTESDWDLQTDVNLKATFFLARATATALREQGSGGSITAFTSQGWMTGGFGGSVVYAATKGGVVSMTRGMARTYASDSIRVNTVSPGGVATPMMLEGMTDDSLSAFVSNIPLGRLAQPDELSGAVLFLASDHARYITGATLNVSGGFLMY